MKILSALFLASALALNAATEWITITMTVTNGVTTNDTYTANGTTRRGGTSRTSTTFQTNGNPMIATTNIFSQFVGWPVPYVTVSNLNSNVLVFKGIGLTMTASNFASLSRATNSLGTNLWALMLPHTQYPLTLQQTNASQLVSLLQVATNNFPEGAAPLANYASLTAAQTLGNKAHTNSTWTGGQINSPQITDATGTFATLGASTAEFQWAHFTNGYSQGPFQLRSRPADGYDYAGIVFDAVWGIYGSASGEFFIINNDNGDIPFYLSGIGGAGTWFTLPVAVSNTLAVDRSFTASNGTFRAGLLTTNSAHYGTNDWNGDVSYSSSSYGSLVSGANSGIPLGTNYFVELSGATSPELHGFEHRRPGYVFEGIVSGATSVVLANNSGSVSDSTLRITTTTGANVTLTNQPARFRMLKRSTDWLVLSHSN